MSIDRNAEYATGWALRRSEELPLDACRNEWQRQGWTEAMENEYPAWCNTSKLRHNYDWCTGFDKCVDGEPIEACRNETERKGWLAADHSGPTQHMSNAQLEAMGI